MGASDICVYDNELRRHEVFVSPFKLATAPVTAAHWAAFIQEGGYARRELWTQEGWRWREHENAHCPEYWFKAGDGYGYFGPLGPRAIQPSEPVTSVNWYEADAYARWEGFRLPTEREWEFAASQLGRFPWGDEAPNQQRAVYGSHQWAPQPVGSRSLGASACGALDMAGNVWEWTSSEFLPYPGFRAFPYDGYSLDHMKGDHFVCRGGSWATAAPILRCTFRNWYVPAYRQGFLGLRCAHD
jgi:iron(II)-dependent oxidoreductase